jgi:sugar O-acyltransferase (sialic acid O-acetyltransferase NeuD family)
MVSNPIITVHGAGGHGRVVAATLRALRRPYRVTDDAQGTRPDPRNPCIIAIGDNAVRRRYEFYTLVAVIHPTAWVADTARIGTGAFIGPHAIIHAGARVGRGTIVNSGAVVEHDCVVGDWVHLAPGVVLCGGAQVGRGALVGANAVVRECRRIADWSVVGCGAAVVSDLSVPGVYVGVPARRRGDKGGICGPLGASGVSSPGAPAAAL